jgi:tetratricopeptide (TPR) repeat protein
MKRMILTGALALAAGVSNLMAQAKAQPKAQAPPKPNAEMAAVQALGAAQAQGNPDAVIKAAEDLLTKFADTVYKADALFMEAIAYEQKRDTEKAQVFAERTLEANPKHFQALLMLAELLAAGTRENDLDKEEKLSRSEKYANDTIPIMKDAPKPPNRPDISDQQWEDLKKDATAEAHVAIGMVAQVRKKYDVAVTEFKAGVDGAAHQNTIYQLRLASALLLASKYDEAVAVCDKIMADQQVQPELRQRAQALRATAIKAGGKNTTPSAAQAAPTAPAPPPPPAEKKQ